MRVRLGLLLALALPALVATGCGPALNEEELGKVVFELQEIPGAGTPFEFPDASRPSATEPETEPPDQTEAAAPAES